MSRSGMTDDVDNDWHQIMWRGAVASSIRGKRGQAFLFEMLEALDAMPEKRLISRDLCAPAFVPPQCGGVCAIGSVGVKRGVEMTALDPDDYDRIASTFGVASPLVQEIEWMNDEGAWIETPEQRWIRMREWVVQNLKMTDELRRYNHNWHLSTLAHRVLKSNKSMFTGGRA